MLRRHVLQQLYWANELLLRESRLGESSVPGLAVHWSPARELRRSFRSDTLRRRPLLL